MTTAQRHVGIGASIALVIYLFALWSEAAYHAGGIGFNEDLTWSRMLAAYRVTTFGDMVRLETIPMGVVAVVGMLAGIIAAFIPRRTFPTWGLSIYLVVLLVSGGWMGMFALVFVPFDTLDGEFLAEGLARVTACGIWAALVSAVLVHRIVKWRRSTEQTGCTKRRAYVSVDNPASLARRR
jgi:hypothetical protein